MRSKARHIKPSRGRFCLSCKNWQNLWCLCFSPLMSPVVINSLHWWCLGHSGRRWWWGNYQPILTGGAGLGRQGEQSSSGSNFKPCICFRTFQHQQVFSFYVLSLLHYSPQITNWPCTLFIKISYRILF